MTTRPPPGDPGGGSKKNSLGEFNQMNLVIEYPFRQFSPIPSQLPRPWKIVGFPFRKADIQPVIQNLPERKTGSKEDSVNSLPTAYTEGEIRSVIRRNDFRFERKLLEETIVGYYITETSVLVLFKCRKSSPRGLSRWHYYYFNRITGKQEYRSYPMPIYEKAARSIYNGPGFVAFRPFT